MKGIDDFEDVFEKLESVQLLAYKANIAGDEEAEDLIEKIDRALDKSYCCLIENLKKEGITL